MNQPHPFKKISSPGDLEQTITSVSRALNALAQGKIILVRDDDNRENEGDLLCALDFATPENVAFMAIHGRGLICAPITKERALQLNLPLMTQASGSQDHQGTAFTVSVDASKGITTGISAHDRSLTAAVLNDPEAKPHDLVRPGHLFPLIAQEGGVFARPGHTEAGVDLPRLAGLNPGSLICEVLMDDGTMARGPELEQMAETFGLEFITVQDIIRYREVMGDVQFQSTGDTRMPTAHGELSIRVYKTDDPSCPELIALHSQGKNPSNEGPVVRIHSECLTGDGFGSHRCDCGSQLDLALAQVAEQGGAVLYLRQEGRGIGIFDKIRAYQLQDQGMDTVEANRALGHQDDYRRYGAAVAVLRDLRLFEFTLLTNNPDKAQIFQVNPEFHVSVAPLVTGLHEENHRYMHTKIQRMGHTIPLQMVSLSF